jgi:hypothetical protein
MEKQQKKQHHHQCCEVVRMMNLLPTRGTGKYEQYTKLCDFSTHPQCSPPDMLDVQPDQIRQSIKPPMPASTVDLERVSSITTSQKNFGSL